MQSPAAEAYSVAGTLLRGIPACRCCRMSASAWPALSEAGTGDERCIWNGPDRRFRPQPLQVSQRHLHPLQRSQSYADVSRGGEASPLPELAYIIFVVGLAAEPLGAYRNNFNR